MAVRKEKNIQTSYKMVNVRAEIYNSAEEVVNDCMHRPTRIKGYDMQHKELRPHWHYVNNYGEALNLLKNGYQPVVDTFKEELKAFPAEGTRFSFANDIQGFAPVVPLALMGVPNSMINMRMKPIKSKVIDVYYDMTANSDKSPEDFINAGKIVLGAIVNLEKQGYRFNLYALQSYLDAHNNKTVDMLCVKVKSSNSPLDLKRMSFPLTHPAFFRVIGFDWQGKSPITRDLGDGRGRALGYDFSKTDTKKIAKEMFGDNALYISCSTIIDEEYDKEKVKEVFTNDKAA